MESNGWVRDEHMVLEPTYRVAGMFKDERIIGESYGATFSYNVCE